MKYILKHIQYLGVNVTIYETRFENIQLKTTCNR